MMELREAIAEADDSKELNQIQSQVTLNVLNVLKIQF